MRKLQYIFNVLMREDILEHDPDLDGSTPCYWVEGKDPFYITDEEWEAMCERYDAL